MTPEQFIIEKSISAVKALYGVDMEASALQVQVTRKEFEGDYTLVVFPLLKVSKSAPEAPGVLRATAMRSTVGSNLMRLA